MQGYAGLASAPREQRVLNGYAGLSSSRLHIENEECYAPHISRLGNDSQAIASNRQNAVAAGRAGVPTPMPGEKALIVHQRRRPATAGAGKPAHSTEALQGAALNVLETPVESRPWRGHGHGRASQPMAERHNLDMALTPREEQTPSQGIKSVACFSSSLQGAAMQPGGAIGHPYPQAIGGHGKRHLHGPPDTVSKEMVHPPEAAPRVLGQSNREVVSGAQTARTHAEGAQLYHANAARNASSSVFDAPRYGPTPAVGVTPSQAARGEEQYDPFFRYSR